MIKSRCLTPAREEYRQPPRDILLAHWLDYSATPLRIKSENCDLWRDVQNTLTERVLARLDSDTSPAVRDFVQLHLLSRGARHTTKNQQNYESRLNECIEGEAPLAGIELERVEAKALDGLATPAELLRLRRSIGMGSVELARVTGNDEHLLERMHAAIAETFAEVGADEQCEQNERIKFRAFNVDITDAKKAPEAVLATRRINVATCEVDTRIMLRESYVLPLANLSKDVRAEILSADRSHGTEAWAETLANVDDLDTRISAAIDSDAAIPISTTFYAVSQTVRQEQQRRHEAERAAYNEEFCRKYPEIIEARRIASGSSASSAD